MLELRQGAQLADRYTLVRRLGGDTRTQTWLANDRLSGASVALKISGSDTGEIESLRNEWQLGIRLMHPHVVRAFEFHAESDTAIFSQQFIDGPDLSAVAGQSLSDILRPVGLLIDALAYVHSKGIVHRDVKSSNVLLDRNGAPYLSDFGVAGAKGSTASGGSPIAQSPQSLDGQVADFPDDIFALGTLIYELISGQPPWSPDNPSDDIRHRSPPPLGTTVDEDIPAGIEQLIGQMLDKDASNRPTAAAAAEAIRVAGFESGVAVVRSAGATELRQPVDERIESRTASEGRQQPDARTTAGDIPFSAAKSRGLNPKIVGAGLLVLVLVLIGVIFVLPDNVSRNPRIDADDPGPVVIEIDSNPRSAEPVVDNAGRPKIYVDPEVRRRVEGARGKPVQKLEGDDDITFSENDADYSGLDDEGRARFEVESTLGEFLSGLDILESRGVELWAPMEYRSARDLYEQGDKAYLQKDYAYAEELYLGALTILEPLYEKIEPTFEAAYAGAVEAFDAGDRLEALRLYELAVAVTPSHAGAQAGYERARNLESVLNLVKQGIEYEEDLELDAAERSFEQAIELDPLWEEAHEGIVRVKKIRTKADFDTRMSDGFKAIADGDYLTARAAFRVAQQLIPDSSEPADGLLQVDQGLRLRDISTLEQEAHSLQKDEHWDAVVSTFEEILKVDKTLAFASEGLQQAKDMSALHKRLDKYIEEPDKLSTPSIMQSATKLVVDVTTRPDIGPRLAAQRDELSRLLRRAATPLTVPLVSDNATDVFVYKVGRIGRFTQREIDLRPGIYVVVGSRPGYRDVRLEFRVAPEVDMEPVIVQCEERI